MKTCAGAFLLRGRAVLLGKRSAERAFYPNVWDIVGGHCLPGEAPEQTLARELKEELGINPERFAKVAVLPEPRPDLHGEAEYHIYVVTEWSGPGPKMLGSEHTEIRWVDVDEIQRLDHALPAMPDLILLTLDRNG